MSRFLDRIKAQQIAAKKAMKDAGEIVNRPGIVPEMVTHIEKLEGILLHLCSYGCPVCNGDCVSANPPVIMCPMREVDEVMKDAAYDARTTEQL